MPTLTIVDTDILIDAARDISEAVDYLHDREQQSHLAVSAITQMELIVGCRDKQELRDLQSFLGRFQVLKVSDAISDRAVELLEQYRLSHGLLIADALIAGTSLVRAEPLASKNQRDYRFIAGINLLPYP